MGQLAAGTVGECGQQRADFGGDVLAGNKTIKTRGWLLGKLEFVHKISSQIQPGERLGQRALFCIGLKSCVDNLGLLRLVHIQIKEQLRALLRWQIGRPDKSSQCLGGHPQIAQIKEKLADLTAAD